MATFVSGEVVGGIMNEIALLAGEDSASDTGPEGLFVTSRFLLFRLK